MEDVYHLIRQEKSPDFHHGGIDPGSPLMNLSHRGGYELSARAVNRFHSPTQFGNLLPPVSTSQTYTKVITERLPSVQRPFLRYFQEDLTSVPCPRPYHSDHQNFMNGYEGEDDYRDEMVDACSPGCDSDAYGHSVNQKRDGYVLLDIDSQEMVSPNVHPSVARQCQDEDVQDVSQPEAVPPRMNDEEYQQIAPAYSNDMPCQEDIYGSCPMQPNNCNLDTLAYASLQHATSAQVTENMEVNACVLNMNMPCGQSRITEERPPRFLVVQDQIFKSSQSPEHLHRLRDDETKEPIGSSVPSPVTSVRVSTALPELYSTFFSTASSTTTSPQLAYHQRSPVNKMSDVYNVSAYRPRRSEYSRNSNSDPVVDEMDFQDTVEVTSEKSEDARPCSQETRSVEEQIVEVHDKTTRPVMNDNASESKKTKIISYRPKDFECRVCKRKFWRDSILLVHSNFPCEDIPLDEFAISIGQQDPLEIKHELKTTFGRSLSQCSICGKLLYNHKNNHMKTHGIIEPYRCLWCRRLFEKYASFERHVMSHSAHNLVKCYICRKVLTTKVSHNRHSKETTIDEYYVCSSCEHGHRIERYQCKVCKKNCKSRSSLESHLSCVHGTCDARADTVAGRHGESSCEGEQRSRSEGERNERKHMPKTSKLRVYKCKRCDKEYLSKHELKKHHEIIHGNDQRGHARNIARRVPSSAVRKAWKCTYCNAIFSTKNEACVHIRMHIKKSAFQCSFCFHEFCTESEIYEHLKEHGQERDEENQYNKHYFQVEITRCTSCNKQLHGGSEVHHHISFHLQEVNVFQCELCDERFSSQQEYFEHSDYVHVQQIRKEHVIMHAEKGKENHSPPKSGNQLEPRRLYMRTYEGPSMLQQSFSQAQINIGYGTDFTKSELFIEHSYFANNPVSTTYDQRTLVASSYPQPGLSASAKCKVQYVGSEYYCGAVATNALTVSPRSTQKGLSNTRPQRNKCFRCSVCCERISDLSALEKHLRLHSLSEFKSITLLVRRINNTGNRALMDSNAL